MLRHRFPEPVCVATAETRGLVQIIFSAEEAIAFLRRHWPGDLSNEAREAFLMCERVEAGRVPPEQGHRFFHKAAKSAGILLYRRRRGFRNFRC